MARRLGFPSLATLAIGDALEVPAPLRCDRTVARKQLTQAAWYLKRTRQVVVKVENTPTGLRAVRVA